MWPSPFGRGLGNLASASGDLVTRGARGPAEAAHSLGQPIRRQRPHASGNFSLWSPSLHSAERGPGVLPSVPIACHAAQSGGHNIARPLHQSPQAGPAAAPTRVQALPAAVEQSSSVPGVNDSSKRSILLPSLPGSSHSDASAPHLQQTATASRSSCSSQSSVTSWGTVQVSMQQVHSSAHSQLSQPDLSQPTKTAYSHQLPSQQLLESCNSDVERRPPSTRVEQASHHSAYQLQATPLPAMLQLCTQQTTAQQQPQQMPDPGPPPMAPRQQSQHARPQQLQASRQLQPAVRCQQMAPGLSRLPPVGRGFSSYEVASPCGMENESEDSGSVATSASNSDDEFEMQQDEQVLAGVGIQPSRSRFRRLIDEDEGDVQSSTHSLKLALPPPAVPPLAFLPASVYAVQCTGANAFHGHNPPSGGTSDGSGHGWRRPASAGAAARREWRADSALGHATVRLGA
eukprot:TRINITY_DN62008_c0_g1_i1.p1 TRINITY_DN62008_c0_g1~~TRINITY_DN62008_c0_g1_i1.p1  ORF type:complete len:458 (+),score=48.81 TRINITY_DN62008_c0_g1_i1:136-1509(+)